MDAYTRNLIVSQHRMFGPNGMVKKMAGKWFVEFAGSGFPTPFRTKAEAIERVRLWVRTLSMEAA